MTDINKDILKPSLKELSSIFEHLQINKLKAKNKNKIEYIEFIFTPEDDIRKDGTKVFKDKETGEYYENDVEHFTQDEVRKSFPLSS